MPQSYVISKARCPKCASSGKDTKKDNLAIYSDGHEYCFSCHYFKVGDKIKTIKQQLYELSELSDIVVLPEDVSPHPNENALTWLYSFGFNYSDIVRNQILWSESYERLIFPIYDDKSELLAWQGRYFGTQDRPKWLSKGKIHELVYTKGSGSSLVLVEDIVSCLKLAKAGVYSGCLFGSYPSKIMLNRYKLVADKLVFWLDYDKKVESVKFKRICEMMGIPSSCIFTTLDPKEYSTNQIKGYINHAYP